MQGTADFGKERLSSLYTSSTKSVKLPYSD